MNTDTSVVVLRSGHHGGLGIVRSLGRLGVPVYCVDADPWESASNSRYCRGRFLLNTESYPAAESISRLLDIGERVGGRPILIPTTDQGVLWIAENAEPLKERYLFPSHRASLIRVLIDKGRMQALARCFGLPIARSTFPLSRRDIEQFIETAEFPVMAKATDADGLRRRTGGTKFLIHSPGELIAFYAKASGGKEPNFLIQEFIPGEDWMFDGCFDGNSECVFGATAEKIRRFPADTGITSLGVCLHNEAVFQMTARFMKAIGYQGILDIGYRYDRRDGNYKVLDINPRIGCTFRLFAAANGMDVARALYLYLTGQPAYPARIDDGRKWIVEDLDLFSSMKLWKDGRLKLMEWLKSFRGIQEAACFAWDDPLPFMRLGLTDWREWRRWKRLRKEALRRSTASTENPCAIRCSDSR